MHCKWFSIYTQFVKKKKTIHKKKSKQDFWTNVYCSGSSSLHWSPSHGFWNVFLSCLVRAWHPFDCHIKTRSLTTSQPRKSSTCVPSHYVWRSRDRGAEGGRVERTRWPSFDIFALDEARQRDSVDSEVHITVVWVAWKSSNQQQHESAWINRCMHTFCTLHKQIHKCTHKAYNVHIHIETDTKPHAAKKMFQCRERVSGIKTGFGFYEKGTLVIECGNVMTSFIVVVVKYLVWPLLICYPWIKPSFYVKNVSPVRWKTLNRETFIIMSSVKMIHRDMYFQCFSLSGFSFPLGRLKNSYCGDPSHNTRCKSHQTVKQLNSGRDSLSSFDTSWCWASPACSHGQADFPVERKL